MSFIHDDFLLSTKTARRLFHEFAADQPILDYHCHLPPQDVAANRQFRNLAEIWLEGDHYKWRAMRANGIAERYCTGRRTARREVPGLGADRAADLAQSPVPLDAPRTEAVLRDRRTARRIERAAHLGAGQCGSCRRRPAGARHSAEVPGKGGLHDRRSHRRSLLPQSHRRVRTGNQGLSDVSARQGAERPHAGTVRTLGGTAGSRQQHQHRHTWRSLWMPSASATTSSTRWAAGFRITA